MTPEDMERRHVARFAALEPSGAYKDALIPGFERTTWTVIGRGGGAPIAADAIHLNLVRAEPGKAAPLHSHPVQEVFMPLSGTWEVSWGDSGEHALTLGPLDVIAVPPGIMRGFRNAGAEPAMLLAMVGGVDPGATTWPEQVRAAAQAAGVELA